MNRSYTVGCLVVAAMAVLLVSGIVYGVKALFGRDEEAPVAAGPVAVEAPVAEAPAEDDVESAMNAALNPWDAFALGNDAYEAGDYELAESYYRNAMKSDPYTLYYRNNLGLALLQQEKNEEALEVFRALVQEGPDTYGYWVNLLVAAQANGITAREIFDQAGGWDYLPALAAAAQAEPGIYTKILEAVYYNAAYMDMELPPEDIDEHGFDYFALGVDPAMILILTAAGEQEQCFYNLLSIIDDMNYTTYGEYDPDIQALLDYLAAKSAQP